MLYIIIAMVIVLIITLKNNTQSLLWYIIDYITMTTHCITMTTVQHINQYTCMIGSKVSTIYR